MNDRSPKPTAEQVRAFLAGAPRAVPAAYVEYIQRFGAVQIDIASIGSGLVWFWPLDEVLTLNAGYKIDEFAKGLFGFGSDGAGELYVFDLRDPQRVTVGQVPSIPLELDQHEVLAESFEEFAGILAGGTPAA
jgi:hypothetical protein